MGLNLEHLYYKKIQPDIQRAHRRLPCYSTDSYPSLRHCQDWRRGGFLLTWIIHKPRWL